MGLSTAYMIRARVVPGNDGMEATMIELKEVEINAEDIPVHMKQGQTETQHMKDNYETNTAMVHPGHINETKTLDLSTD